MSRNSVGPLLVVRCMPRMDLLPGVSHGSEPRVHCDSRSIIRDARYAALIRDAMQLTLVLAVDAALLLYPTCRLPYLDHRMTVIVLAIGSFLSVGCVIASRYLPTMRARRIARTWSTSEQLRLLDTRVG